MTNKKLWDESVQTAPFVEFILKEMEKRNLRTDVCKSIGAVILDYSYESEIQSGRDKDEVMKEIEAIADGLKQSVLHR